MPSSVELVDSDVSLLEDDEVIISVELLVELDSELELLLEVVIASVELLEELELLLEVVISSVELELVIIRGSSSASSRILCHSPATV